MSAEAEAVLEMERKLLEIFRASLPDTPEFRKVEQVARVLALEDGVGDYIDRIVMGHPHGGAETVPTIARVGRKGCVAILFPLQPAWATYIRDARSAIEAMKEGEKP